MKKAFLFSLMGLSLVSMAYSAIAEAVEEYTWFEENASTFEVNQGDKWGYSSGAAYSSEGLIQIDATRDLGDVSYLPNTVTGFQYVVEGQMFFVRAYARPPSDTRDLAAVTVGDHEDGTPSVMIVYNAVSNEWVWTSAPARTNEFYDVRTAFDYTAGTMTYSYKAVDAEEYTELGTFDLPIGAELPSEAAFSGRGSLNTLDAKYTAIVPPTPPPEPEPTDPPTPYDPWTNTAGIVTWAGTGGSSTSAALNSNAAKYAEFVKVSTNEWRDSGNIYTGDCAYTVFPGYSNETKAVTFANAFKQGAEGFKSPGMTLRLFENSGDMPSTITSPFSVNIAGLIVEKDAKDYVFSETGSYAFSLGDMSGVAPTRFEFNESVKISHTKKPITFFGDVTLAFKRPLTNDFNSAASSTSAPVNLDPATHTRLAFEGEGALKVNTVNATGDVALVFTAVPQDHSSSEAFLIGKLKVSPETDIAFPTNWEDGTSLKLSSASLTVMAPAGTSTAQKNITKVVQVGGESFLATLKYNTTIRTVSYTKTIMTSSYLFVEAGTEGTLDGSEEEAAPLSFTGLVTIDGALTLNGYVKFTKQVKGDGLIYLDGSRLTSATSDRVLMATFYTAMDATRVQLIHGDGWGLSFEGTAVYAVRRDYSKWAVNTAFYTWGGPDGQVDAFTTSGQYLLTDTKKGEAGEGVTAGIISAKVPGHLGENILPWTIWSSSSNSIAPGYALRFVRDHVGELDIAISDFALGGLMIEEGATNVSFISASASRATLLGDKNGEADTWFLFNENFKMARNGAVTLYGPVNVSVAKDMTADLNSAYPAQTFTLDAATSASLKMHGAGEITNATIVATGAVMLDYSDLDASRTTPFIRGGLTVDKNTNFKFPAGVTSYVLCGGTLNATAADGLRYLTVGDTSFYANLTFNASTRTVTWAKATVNTATISGTNTWAGIKWDNGTFNYNLPALITLAGDAYINFSAKVSTKLPALSFSGAHSVELAYTKYPTLSTVTCSEGATWAIVVPTTTDLPMTATTVMEIPKGMTYIFDGASKAFPKSRPIKLIVNGRLASRRYCKFTNTGSVVNETGTIEVLSGGLTWDGAEDGLQGTLQVDEGATFINSHALNFLNGAAATVDIGGTNTMGSTTWTIGAETKLKLRARSVFTGIGSGSYGALHFAEPATIQFLKTVDGEGGDASLQGNLVIEDGVSALTFAVEEGVTGVVASATINDMGASRMVKTGEGVLRIERASSIGFNGRPDFEEGEVILSSGSYDFDYDSDALVRIPDGVTLTTAAASVGRVIVEQGGTLRLRLEEEDIVFGYIAGGVTLPSGTNIIFVKPDGTTIEGEGTVLTGTATIWTGKAGTARWDQAGNWSTGKVPTATDPVILPLETTIELPISGLASMVYVRAPVTFNCTSDRILQADLIRCDGYGSITKTGAAKLTLLAPIGTEEDPFSGKIDIQDGSIEFAMTGSWISGEVTGAGDVIVGDGALVNFMGELTYTGFTEVGVDGEMGLPVMGLGPTVALFGDETAAIRFDNLTLTTAFSPVDSTMDVTDWFGSVYFYNCELEEADLSSLSKFPQLKFTAVSGSFKRNTSFPGNLILEDAEDGTYALRITDGDPGRYFSVGSISGKGTVGATEPITAFQFHANTATNFNGNVRVMGAGTHFSVNISDETDSSLQGGIFLGTNQVQQVRANDEWYSSGIISLASNSTLSVSGALHGQLTGLGTVSFASPECIDIDYSGLISGTWSGLVKLVSWGNLSDTTGLQWFGNSHSRVGFENCSGFFSTLRVSWGMQLCSSKLGTTGLTITNGISGGVLTFSSACGDGIFRCMVPDAYSANPTQTYQFLDASNFTGGFVIDDDCNMSIVIGDGEKSSYAGCIDYMDGVTIRGGLKSSAPNCTFGDTLNVIGKVGDVIMSVTGTLTGDFSATTVYPTESDLRASYGLNLNGDSRLLKVALLPSAPSMEITDVSFVYGSDLTNATVNVTVANYWEGNLYEQGAWATVIVRDSEGTIIDVVGQAITHDGVYGFGPLLLFGGGKDYTYELRVEAYETGLSAPDEIVDEISLHQPSRLIGSWIHENWKSFESAIPSWKTGIWTIPDTSHAYVEDETIRIEASAQETAVQFDAYETRTNELVELEVALAPDGGFDLDSIKPIDPTQAGIIFVCDDDNNLDFAGYNPASNRFERLFRTDDKTHPHLYTTYRGRVSFNYLEGTVAYSINGGILTNSHGTTVFPMTAEQKAARASIQTAKFFGNGSMTSLDASERDSNVAEVGETLYRSLDEALEVAKLEGETVKLLWDASWRPTVADAGYSCKIDTNGHQLTIDGSALNELKTRGYALVQHEDGSYSIDCVTYEITYTRNNEEGTEEDYSQSFSATNNIITLMPNTFKRVHEDFVGWNRSADGKEGTNIADKATIDMDDFGYSNMTFYAQWDIASRRVLIEPPAEDVYVEAVSTNEVLITDTLTFFGAGAATGDRSASFYVHDGDEVTVLFTTDIEKSLEPYDTLKFTLGENDYRLRQSDIPTVVKEAPTALTTIQRWAYSKGITPSALLGSEYVNSSYCLNTKSLMNSQTKVEITDFATTADGCSFKVKVDGELVSGTTESIAKMIFLTESLSDKGINPTAEAISVSEDGRVTVKTPSKGTFIRLVIPKD